MEDIEMDSAMAEATSGLKHGSMSPLPSSTTKRTKVDVTTLNPKLNATFATLHYMPQRLQEASETLAK